MKLNCDEASVTGLNHVRRGEIGQDYALSGQENHFYGPEAYAIVSDGCSTGKRTDLGSRFVSLVAREFVRKHEVEPPPHATFRHWMRYNLTSLCQELGLEREDLFATCVCAFAGPKTTRVSIIGDGVVVARFRDGTYNFYKYDWSDNIPMYPVYGDEEYRILESRSAVLTRELTTFRPANPPITSLEETVDVVQSKVKEEDTASVLEFPTSELVDIAVFSDGLTQIRGLDWKQAAIELLSFKNTAGVFVKRRMRSFMDRCKKEGLSPEDDLSYAVIHIETEDNDGK